MNNNNFSKYRLLPFATIEAATTGDSEAMSAVNRHFGGYIATLSVRPMRDADGNEHYAVDETIRRELESKLAAAVMKFRVV
ncbi:MAG: helix-turn-helix domain-containing protein [Oscillospiraceae bacterium]|nr:helix-turn-helix domain-containing protein [Oscillospiraceae bacterium]